MLLYNQVKREKQNAKGEINNEKNYNQQWNNDKEESNRDCETV